MAIVPPGTPYDEPSHFGTVQYYATMHRMPVLGQPGVSYEALHLCTLGRSLGHREGEFPNAERIARETVTLPLFTTMRDADVDRVCDACADVLARHASSTEPAR